MNVPPGALTVTAFVADDIFPVKRCTKTIRSKKPAIVGVTRCISMIKAFPNPSR
jgi:hypothetical protein